MPSFDVVSQIETQEIVNAVDQANREVGNRYDFKGSDARIEWADPTLTIHADDEFKVDQVRDILHNKLAKRKVDIGALEEKQVEIAGSGKAQQLITIKQGIDQELAKKIVKEIKQQKFKVQSSIQGDQVRVSGKKRDNLQEVIAMLSNKEMGLPLQFINFRD